MFYEDVGVLPALLVFIIVIGLYRVVTWLTGKSRWFEVLIEGKTVTLINEGKFSVAKFEKEPMAQDTKYGFRNKSPIVCSKLWIIAKKMPQYRISRVFQRKHSAQCSGSHVQMGRGKTHLLSILQKVRQRQPFPRWNTYHQWERGARGKTGYRMIPAFYSVQAALFEGIRRFSIAYFLDHLIGHDTDFFCGDNAYR